MKGILLVGSEDRGLPVVIDAEPFLFVEAFARLDTAVERAGVLVGHLVKRAHLRGAGSARGIGSASRLPHYAGIATHLLITGANEIGRGSQPRIAIGLAHGRWEGICAVIGRVFRRETVVGWFHAGPGLGVHLSSHDVSVRQRFPRALRFVAYVVDTQANSRALFRWDGDAMVRCSGFFVRGNGKELRVVRRLIGSGSAVSAEGEELSAELGARGAFEDLGSGHMRATRTRRRRGAPRPRPLIRVAAATLAALAVAGAAAFVALNRGVPRRGNPPPVAADAGRTQPPTAAAPPQASAAEGYERASPDGDLAPATLPTGAREPAEETSPPASYLVQPGDTLWEISSRFYGAGSKYGVLARSNGISDPDIIYAGDTLEVPANGR